MRVLQLKSFEDISLGSPKVFPSCSSEKLWELEIASNPGCLDMSLPALVPDLTGKSIYTTPAQSPTEFPVHDPFANPEEHNGYDPGLKDEQFKSSADAIYTLAQISANGSPQSANPPEIPPKIPQRPSGRGIPPAPTVEDEKPCIPPRPATREIPLVSKSEKGQPQLPTRPPSQPERRAPKPTPEIPTRPAPAPFKQRATLPPSTIPEETIEQVGSPVLKYSRHPEKLIAYLIPLPKPNLSKYLDREDDLPEVWRRHQNDANESGTNLTSQRYLLYTPPSPHLLKPAKGVKEKKRHMGRRKMQEQV